MLTSSATGSSTWSASNLRIECLRDVIECCSVNTLVNEVSAVATDGSVFSNRDHRRSDSCGSIDVNDIFIFSSPIVATVNGKFGIDCSPHRRLRMTTEEILLSKFGPLLTLPQLASLLDRSPDGLRITLRGGSEFAARWNQARRKIGRRVYFRAPDVARLIDTTTAG